jgi:hypothetical protein
MMHERVTLLRQKVLQSFLEWLFWSCSVHLCIGDEGGEEEEEGEVE